MPKGKTKKFIDKKNSVTFHLVHRSQKDPLIADETAPQRVLVPVGDSQSQKQEKKSTVDIVKRKEEQQKYGIYFDDDYDYLQHLKDVDKAPLEWQRVENENVSEKNKNKDAPKINLPSSVFASNVEAVVGLLNKAAPTGFNLDVDPDIAAALDDDFDFDNPNNELEDNFLELANGKDGDDEFDQYYEYEKELNYDNSVGVADELVEYFEHRTAYLPDDERDEICSLHGSQYTFKDEETKSRFTEYSMSSSVIRRNEQLRLLDDKFDKMYAVYDENEVGALDCDEIEGYIPLESELVQQCADEFEKKPRQNAENVAQLMRDKLKIIDNEYSSSEDEDGLQKLVVTAREREQWDCESILSMYSNIYNHPKLISEPKSPEKIQINPRTGIPKDILGNNGNRLTAKTLAQFDSQNYDGKAKGTQSIAETMKSTLSTLSLRPKGESLEERKERKKALKEYRKERRIEKKANTEAFKNEKKRQEKIMLNNRQNIQGNHIL